MKGILIAGLFLAAVPASPQAVKEYIRLGGQLIAVESNAGQVTPTVDGLSPASGTGSGTIFFTFSDFNGATDLGILNVLVAPALDGRNACYLAYVRSANLLYLLSDDTATAEALTVGTSATIGVNNTRCDVNGSGTTAVLAANTITLTVNFTFKAPFTGRQAVYAAARDTLENNSGWQSMGVRGLPMPASPPNTPQVVSMTPQRSTAQRQTFTVVYSDPNGGTDLNILNLLINPVLDGANACYLAYVRTSAIFYLVTDNGGDLLQLQGAPGSQATVSNSQCRLYASGSSAQVSGNTLTLNLDLEFFRPKFGGNRVVYAAALDLASNNSTWQVMGTIGAP